MKDNVKVKELNVSGFILFRRINLCALVIISMLTSISSIAQLETTPRGISTSSTTPAGLGRFIDFPVSLSNGTSNISIPLYELKSSRISVPINLLYHSGGITVNERTSTMGLGWILDAGGCITRNIRGLPDESMYGFLNMVFPDQADPTYPQKDQCMQNFIANAYVKSINYDGEPDIFYYSFPGDNGKFVFKNKSAKQQDPETLTIPYKPLRIKYDPSAYAFTITGSDGVTYEFGSDPKNTSIAGFNESVSVDFYYNFYADNLTSLKEARTAWHLTKIISADKSDTILFKYADQQNYYQNVTSSVTGIIDYGTPGVSPPLSAYPLQYKTSASSRDEYSAVLTEVDCKMGKVVFNYSANAAFPALQSIDVYKVTGDNPQKIRSYNFFSSFFTTNSARNDNTLRLDSVRETGFADDGSFIKTCLFVHL